MFLIQPRNPLLTTVNAALKQSPQGPSPRWHRTWGSRAWPQFPAPHALLGSPLPSAGAQPLLTTPVASPALPCPPGTGQPSTPPAVVSEELLPYSSSCPPSTFLATRAHYCPMGGLLPPSTARSSSMVLPSSRYLGTNKSINTVFSCGKAAGRALLPFQFPASSAASASLTGL